jgi:hypothetical protein
MNGLAAEPQRRTCLGTEQLSGGATVTHMQTWLAQGQTRDMPAFACMDLFRTLIVCVLYAHMRTQTHSTVTLLSVSARPPASHATHMARCFPVLNPFEPEIGSEK